MFHINPISYIGKDYHLVRKNKKVKPVSEVNKSNKDRNNDSNSSNFKEILEEEIQKQKKKNMKEG